MPELNISKIQLPNGDYLNIRDPQVPDVNAAIETILGGGSSESTADRAGISSPFLLGAVRSTAGYSQGYYPVMKWTWYQETNDNEKTSSAELSVTTTASSLLLVCVMHRADITLPSGWTLVRKSKTADNGTSQQWISVYKKSAVAGTHSLTVTQSENVRMSAKLIVLYDASDVSVVQDDLITEFPFSPNSATGNRRLYLFSSITANNSSSNNAITVNANGIDDFPQATEKRFTACYDYSGGTGHPIANYYQEAYTANSANVLVFDIMEVQ